MSSTSDKASGIGNEIIGKTKQAIGDITGDKVLHIEGVIQEQKGIGQKAVGDAKSAVKTLVDKS